MNPFELTGLKPWHPNVLVSAGKLGINSEIPGPSTPRDATIARCLRTAQG